MSTEHSVRTERRTEQKIMLVQSLGKKIRYTFLSLMVFLLLLLGAEFLSSALPDSNAFRRWQFFVLFSLDRWDYLSASWSRLRLETVMENPGYETYVEEPESNRPPFDHVPYAFSVETNEFGFRDQSFDSSSKPSFVFSTSFLLRFACSVEPMDRNIE